MSIILAVRNLNWRNVSYLADGARPRVRRKIQRLIQEAYYFVSEYEARQLNRQLMSPEDQEHERIHLLCGGRIA